MGDLRYILMCKWVDEDDEDMACVGVYEDVKTAWVFALVNFIANSSLSLWMNYDLDDPRRHLPLLFSFGPFKELFRQAKEKENGADVTLLHRLDVAAAEWAIQETVTCHDVWLLVQALCSGSGTNYKVFRFNPQIRKTGADAVKLLKSS